MILRLPLRVELFNEKDELVQTITSSKKSQICLKLHGLSDGKRRLWTYGTCKVFYNRPNDFWNEFKFESLNQFEAGLLTVTEKPLIEYLRPDIPENYLSKRPVSPAQLAALKKAQSKSGMVL